MIEETEKGKKIIKSFESLKKDRVRWESHWEEIARYIYPNQDDDFLGNDTNKLGGEKRTRNIVDPTGPQAMQTLAAGLHGLMTNPASKWFKLKIRNQNNKDIEKWLKSVEDVMFQEMSNSNSAFSSHIHEMYLDFCSFSTACIFIGENNDLNKVIYKAIPLSQILITENSEGIVDTAYRKIIFTANQMLEKFGSDNISDKVKKALEKNDLIKKFSVIHCVKPNSDRTAFDSIYIEEQEKNTLKEGEFSSFPYGIPRFNKASNEVYGRGPSMLALPEIKMLNKMRTIILKIAEKVADPPLAIKDDTIIGPPNLIPGGINYLRSDFDNNPIQTLDISGSAPITHEMMQESRSFIRSIYYLDQIQFTGEHNMTATEVIQRTEERMRMLGPLLGRMQKECLDVVINRTFEILIKQKRIPDFPIGYDINEYEIEYISPIAKAQKQMDASNLERAMSLASPLISLDPSLSKKPNGEQIMEDIFDLYSLSPNWYLSKEEFAEKVKGLQDQENLQNAVAIGKEASDIGVNLQKTIGVQ